MRKDGVWLGLDISADAGAALRPKKITFWKEDKFKNHQPEDPFHYKADALAGLSLIHLCANSSHKNFSSNWNLSFCKNAWAVLEPHRELFQRSHYRVESLRQSMKSEPTQISQYFERNFSEVLDSSIHNWGIDLKHLTSLLESIDYMENKMEIPLLYNFKMKFSRETLEKLHYVHSMLFNLRALIGMDYNAHVQDPTLEAVKIDSITDYVSKAEYLSNDAMLYFQFKKQKANLPQSTFNDLEKAFKTYNHNGYCLIESLPKSFLNGLNTEELEETLYLVQMDWLLGSDAGLLYRIREELYGLSEGYDRVFWPELEGKKIYTQSKLEINCFVSEKDISPATEAA